jgi:hypothetical protein
VTKALTLFRRVATAICVFFAFTSTAQYHTEGKFAAKLKSAPLHVLVKNLDHPDTKAWMDAIRKGWTLSEVKFVTAEQATQFYATGNYFLSIGAWESMLSAEQMQRPESVYGIDVGKSSLFIELWTPHEDWLKKKKKPLAPEDKMQIGRVEQTITMQARIRPRPIDFVNMEQSVILSWGKGLLKNYLQQLSSHLASDKPQKYDKDFSNESKLKDVKKEKLYVPDFVFVEPTVNCLLGKCTFKDVYSDPKEIMSDYKGAYEVISTKDLNDKILNETSPFYYLLCIVSGTDKYITIVNSLTGEVIHKTYVSNSAKLKEKDIKKLFKEMQ